MEHKIIKQFETFQPSTIRENRITEADVFNGMCLIRRYRVTVEEIVEPKEVLIERLLALHRENSSTHSSNRHAMNVEAKKLGVELKHFWDKLNS